MPLQLPVTDRALVEACAAELSAAAASSSGAEGAAAVDAAQLRFAWALAHSASDADLQRGREMLEHLVSKGGTRESLYLLAVAHFRAGQLLEARRWAEAALAVAPSCHQSEALRAACEEQLAEDALMAGLGVAGVGLATIAVALLAGAMRRKT